MQQKKERVNGTWNKIKIFFGAREKLTPEKARRINNFEIKERVIHIDGEFTQEEITFLRHNLKRNVKVDKTIRCNNEDKLSK